MSQKILVDLSVDVKSANKNIEKTRDALGDLIDVQVEALDQIKKSNKANEDSNKKLLKSTKKAEGGFRSFFKVLKGAAILTVIVKAVQMLGSALASNQVIADKVAVVFGTISSVMTQVGTAFADAAEQVSSSGESFEGVKGVLGGLISGVLAVFKGTIDGIRLGVYNAQLAWEESFFGDKDQSTIDRLNGKIEATKASLSGTWETLKTAGSQIADNFDEAISEIGQITSIAVESIKKIDIQQTASDQDRLIQLKNQTKLAIAENEKLQFIYQRDAELQRQIRDDVTLSLAERTKANDELGVVLEKQLELQLANAKKREEQARFDLSMNKDNIDLQVQLLEAEKNVADVRENISGFQSEQIKNSQDLAVEEIDMINSKAEAETNRAINAKAFAAEREADEIIRLEMLVESIAFEEEQETIRLQNQIERLAIGTQAKQDAEQQLFDFQQDISQRSLKAGADIAKAESKRDKSVAAQKLELTKQTFGLLATILGENSKAGKAAAIAAATINTYQGVTEVLANKSTLPEPFATIQKIVSIGGVLATGFKTVKEITSVPKPNIPGAKGGSSGGGRSVNMSVGSMPAAPAAFNVVGASATSQLAETISNKEDKPQRAYVVSNDVTSAQSMDRSIVENASI
tara:strand:+ start:7292 stop:9193 length:1902 start_codon:yes stop_codon:yes gene_type:complete